MREEIQTIVDVRLAIYLINSGRGEEAVEVLQNLSARLMDRAVGMSTGSPRGKWRQGEGLLASAMERIKRIEEAIGK